MPKMRAMVSLNSVGLAGVKRICDLGLLAIHGHRNGWGLYARHPLLGVEYPAWQKMWRLARADQLHVNGLQNKFWEPDDSVVRSLQACLTPMFRPDDTAMPVVSSGQWGGQAPETYRRAGTTDLMYLAGGGILAHDRNLAEGLPVKDALYNAKGGEARIEPEVPLADGGAAVEPWTNKLAP